MKNQMTTATLADFTAHERQVIAKLAERLVHNMEAATLATALAGTVLPIKNTTTAQRLALAGLTAEQVHRLANS